MTRLDQCIRTDSGLAGSDWQGWTRVYLLGGAVSEWAGERPNGTARDLDVIVAVNLRAAQGYSSFEGMSAGEAASALNAAFHRRFNDDHWHPPFGGVWALTAFCNMRAWDVTQIKPYAAYDLTHGRWAVEPPHLPGHSLADFDPAVLAQAKAVAAEARAILRMPEPLRTREATALWDRLHAGRSTAFSERGTGWDDPGNVTEKWLAYAPRHVLDQIRELAHAPRTATAALPLLHRGISVEVSPDEVAGAYRSGGMAAVHDVIRSGIRHPAGQHWSESEEIARGFGHRLEHEPRTSLSSFSLHVPVVLHAHVDPRHHETDPDRLRELMVGHGSREEHEVTVKQGAPVSITGMHAALPDRPDWPEHMDQVLGSYDEDPHLSAWRSEPHSWHDLDRPWVRQAMMLSDDFRRVVSTTPRSQLVLMTLQPGEEIGSEVHEDGDQHFAVLSGTGHSVTNGARRELCEGDAFTVPAGTRHNVTSAPGDVLRLATVYAPPRHAPGTVHRTKAEAERAERSGKDVPPKTAARETLDDDDSHKVYLRFGDWPPNERSHNYAMGWDEEGVSAYELNRRGDPMDPDPTGFSRHHVHDEECEPDCDLDWMNENYGETSPADRVRRAERARYNGRDNKSDTGHLVKGEMVGFGHDAEPLLRNVRRVGDWIDHRHLFLDQAQPHRLARDPDDPDYEEPTEKPPYGHRREASAEHETWYHLTDNPHFSLDPEHEPEDNSFSIEDRSGQKGVYLGKDPERWFSGAGEGYARPYLAEVHAHPSVKEAPGVHGRWGGEMFVPARHFDKLRLHRVIPIDAHAREYYGTHGWIESHHGTEFDTGEPLRRNPANPHYPFKPEWNDPSAYRYPGPDVREMSPEEHARHRDRWLHYLKHDRGFDDEDLGYFRQQHDSHMPPRTAASPAGEQQRPKRTPGNAMVYLDVPHGTVQPYAGQEGGHHVALAYLPRAIGDEDFAKVVDRAREAATRYPPLRGTLGGHLTFPPGAPSNKRRVAVVPAVIPGVHRLQAEFGEFDRAHYEHYTPHVTRAQLSGNDPDPEPHPQVPVSFTHVHVRRGEEVHSFPLTGLSPAERATQAEERIRHPERYKRHQQQDAELRMQRERDDAEHAMWLHEQSTLKPWAREAVSGYDGLTKRTGMIYLDLPPGTVRPVPGGVDDHHVTLVYLGADVSDEAFEEACRRAQAATAKCPPLEGVLRGIDIFPPSNSSDGKVPAFVPVFIGGVGRLRRELEDLSASEHKDWKPHCTLAYLGDGDSLPAPHPAVPLRFTHLHVKRGNDVVSFPLTGRVHGG